MPAKNRQALYAASRQLMHAAKHRSKRLSEGDDAEPGAPPLNGSPAAQVQVPAQQKALKQAARRRKGLKRKLEAEAEGGPGELEASGEGPGEKQAAMEGVLDRHTPAHWCDAAPSVDLKGSARSQLFSSAPAVLRCAGCIHPALRAVSASCPSSTVPRLTGPCESPPG